jgi:hypothetical protein
MTIVCGAVRKHGGDCIDVVRAFNGSSGTGDAYKAGLMTKDPCCYPARKASSSWPSCSTVSVSGLSTADSAPGDADKALVLIEAQLASGDWTDPDRGKVKR